MLQKSSISKTLEVFFISPTKEHYLMDISRNLGLAHTSVKKNLIQLVKINLVKQRILNRGGRKFPVYNANINNNQFKKLKIISNITAIFESSLVNFIEEKLTPKSIVLFGSYSRGEDTEDSDIDIFVECNQEELDLKLFEKKLKRKLQLHFKKDFTSFPKELKNNIINGVVLNGFLEGYK